MIRIETKSKNFLNKFDNFLNLRSEYSESKNMIVKILKDIRKGR